MNVFGEIVQKQSIAHLKLRNLSSKYVQIAGAINSWNSSKQLPPPRCCLAIVQMPGQPGERHLTPGSWISRPYPGLLPSQAAPSATQGLR